VILNTELRLAPFSPSALVGQATAFQDSLQVGAFYDFVDIQQPDQVPGTSPPARLESVGVLLNYSAGRNVDLAIDGGLQLRRGPNETKTGGVVAMSLTVSF
jgi:hypothetical protein